ncbi:hypothetical protein KP509_11G088300 [Ceratopteris richardii]|uniref:EF-hand domain-containing protein n=1 Tax=Ceratopteris richardii TaxID=49495 RepID=A0A8T2TS17_CERRI|nr:hypothetical protein KP509_11G088300 [Ceratopteris richardii]
MDCLPFLQREAQDSTPSKQDRRHIRRVFDICDVDGDGFLNVEELRKWTEKVGVVVREVCIRNILHSHDLDYDGRLSFEEFVELWETLMASDSGKREMSSARSVLLEGEHNHADNENLCSSDECGPCNDSDLLDAFRVFDKDGNGFISPEELNATLMQLGLLPSSTSLARVHSMIRRVDTDGDGQVSFTEFQNMMKVSDLA